MSNYTIEAFDTNEKKIDSIVVKNAVYGGKKYNAAMEELKKRLVTSRSEDEVQKFSFYGTKAK